LHIFPEGATTNGSELIQFKRGAFHNLLPVKPIIIKYYSPGTSAASDILGFAKHLMIVTLGVFFTINV
jgi:1-acyl-sn-glycerol-3-phosphate acyltransferase